MAKIPAKIAEKVKNPEGAETFPVTCFLEKIRTKTTIAGIPKRARKPKMAAHEKQRNPSGHLRNINKRLESTFQAQIISPHIYQAPLEFLTFLLIN